MTRPLGPNCSKLSWHVYRHSKSHSSLPHCAPAADVRQPRPTSLYTQRCSPPSLGVGASVLLLPASWACCCPCLSSPPPAGQTGWSRQTGEHLKGRETEANAVSGFRPCDVYIQASLSVGLGSEWVSACTGRAWCCTAYGPVFLTTYPKAPIMWTLGAAQGYEEAWRKINVSYIPRRPWIHSPVIFLCWLVPPTGSAAAAAPWLTQLASPNRRPVTDAPYWTRTLGLSATSLLAVVSNR